MSTSPGVSVHARSSFQVGLLACGCALAALLLDLPILVFAAVIFGVPAITLAIAGWCEVWRSAGQRRGAGLAFGGIAATVVAGFISPAVAVG